MGTTKNRLIFKILLKLINFEFVFGFDSLGFDSQVSKKNVCLYSKIYETKTREINKSTRSVCYQTDPDSSLYSASSLEHNIVQITQFL